VVTQRRLGGRWRALARCAIQRPRGRTVRLRPDPSIAPLVCETVPAPRGRGKPPLVADIGPTGNPDGKDGSRRSTFPWVISTASLPDRHAFESLRGSLADRIGGRVRPEKTDNLCSRNRCAEVSLCRTARVQTRRSDLLTAQSQSLASSKKAARSDFIVGNKEW
jgi:hypothetical protein